MTGTDEGIWRRIKKIPFAVHIAPEERDSNLVEKLRLELPGILAWAVRGCLAWQAHGLGKSPEIETATEEYRATEDAIGMFLEERCETRPDLKTNDRDLYSAYSVWARTSNEFVLSQKDFKKALESKGFGTKRSKDARWRAGLRLLPPAVAAPHLRAVS